MVRRATLAAALAAAVVGLAPGLAPVARAGSVERGTPPAEPYGPPVAEPVLRLQGSGVLRWGFLVKVYAAALYVADGAPFDPEADAARRLELTYFVGFPAADLRGAADHVLRQNFAPEALAPLRERIDAFHASYVAVRSGDRVAISYVPGRGTELTLNGRRLALVEGADFARAYFAIFLGEKPVDAGVRKALLGT